MRRQNFVDHPLLVRAEYLFRKQNEYEGKKCVHEVGGFDQTY